MTRVVSIFFASLVFLLAGAPPTSEAKKRKLEPKLDEIFSPKQLKQDLSVLRTVLEKGHPGLYLYTSKQEFDELFEKAELDLADSGTLRKFYLTVAPIVEKVYCGHTYFDLPGKLLGTMLKEAELFPLPLVFLNRKAYLDHSDLEIPLGAEIVSIEGKPMDQVIGRLLPYVRSDGYNQTMKYRMMAEEFALHYFLSFGRSSSFQIEYLPLDSEKSVVKRIPSVSGKILQKRLDHRHTRKGKLKKYRMGEPEKGVFLLSMNSFDFGLNKKGKQKYKVFLQEKFREIEERDDVQSVILDLRQNEGGFVGNDTRLFSYFAQEPFRDCKSAETSSLRIPEKDHLARNQFPKMLERILAKEFKETESGRFMMIEEKIREWKPNKTAFTGKIYVLISGLTHSGGAVICSLLLNNENVTFIGQETGGGHATFSAGNMVLYDLPNTNCQLEIPLIRYENDLRGREFPKGSGIRPDHKIVQSPKDLIGNVDTVMEFALGMARSSLK